MSPQPYKAAKRKDLIVKVADLYKKEYTFRAIGKILDISHETARKLWKESQAVDKN